MPTREDVYVAISMDMEYIEDHYKHRCATTDEEYIPLFNWYTEDFVINILRLNAKLLNVQSKYEQLDLVRTISAYCSLAIENCGGQARDVNTGYSMSFLEPRLTPGKVQAVINTECQYIQESIEKQNSHASYIVRIQHELNNLVSEWSTKPGEEYALDTVRVIAGLCVCCLEQFGVGLRAPFKP